MESRTKVKLSDNDIRRVVENAFGNRQISGIHELKEGMFNTAFQISLNGRSPIILKIGPPDDANIMTYEKDILRAEVETMKLVTTNPAVPVPDIPFSDFSQTLLPYNYYFMDVIQGKTWDKIRDDLTPEQNNHIEYQLGQITAAINQYTNNTFGYYAYGKDFGNWPDCFRWMCGLLFADARRYQIAVGISEDWFFDQFQKHRAIFDEITTPKLIHWDLWAGNIFITFDRDKPKIEGIIDFERALWGDPLMESYLGRLSGIPNYMAGYGANILATPNQRLRRIFYNLYLDILMVTEDGPRQFDDKSTVQWAKERMVRDIEMMEGWLQVTK